MSLYDNFRTCVHSICAPQRVLGPNACGSFHSFDTGLCVTGQALVIMALLGRSVRIDTLLGIDRICRLRLNRCDLFVSFVLRKVENTHDDKSSGTDLATGHEQLVYKRKRVTGLESITSRTSPFLYLLHLVSTPVALISIADSPSFLRMERHVGHATKVPQGSHRPILPA
jgi:hypothetical protein